MAIGRGVGDRMTRSRARDEARIDGLIGDIYTAATEPERMPAVLDAIAAALGAKGLLMGPLSRATSPDPGLVTYASEVFHEAVPDYLNHFVAINPRKNWLTHNDIGERIFTDYDFIDDGGIRRSEFYNDFLMRNDNLFSLDRVTQAVAPERRLWISLQYARRAKAPERRDRELFERLSSHLIRALGVWRSANLLRPHEIDLLERWDGAALVLSASGRILAMNADAEALDGQGIGVGRRVLRTTAPRDGGRLDRLLAEALGAPGVPATAGTMVIARPETGRPLLLKAVPLRRDAVDRWRFDFADEIPRILVLVHEPGNERPPAVEEPLRLLGLSPAEVRVAILIGGGQAPEDAAEQLGLAVSTVRLHIRRIYEKLGLRRQVELVRLIAGLARLGGREPDDR